MDPLDANPFASWCVAMMWILRFWWHDWRVHRWELIRRRRQRAMVRAEYVKHKHGVKWQQMKNELTDYK